MLKINTLIHWDSIIICLSLRYGIKTNDLAFNPLFLIKAKQLPGIN